MMKKITLVCSKFLCTLTLIFSSWSCFAQLAGCNLNIPPFTSNGVEVTHILGENNIIYDEPGMWQFCGNSALLVPNIPIVHLGDPGIIWDPPWDPFTYTLNFSKPIYSMKFLLLVGGEEYFVFETEESSINLQSLYSCQSNISGDTILLGYGGGLAGDGIYTISFACPTYSYTISGQGGGGGTRFLICESSLTTPNLWGRVSGDSSVCRQDSVLFEAFGGLAPYTFSYSVNGGGVQTLQSASPEVWLPTPAAAGIYNFELLQVQDGNGSIAVIACNNNHTIEVLPPPNAQFGVSPSSGAAPLDIQITNNSSNASDFSWYINNEFLGTELTNYTLEDPGSYELKLVATLDSFSCSDSVIQTISVFSSENTTFQIGPNPNNGTFSIITNDLSLENANIKIYNTLGAIISDGIYAFEQGKINQSIVLASGVYFVEISGVEVEFEERRKIVVSN